MPETRRTLNHVTGCLAGGAAGDALGAPVEFMSRTEIRSTYGPGGIARYAPAYGRKGAVTDDTQMTLFTAEGLVLSRVRGSGPGDILPFVHQAYLRWLSTQRTVDPSRLVDRHGTCAMVDGILITRPELYARRAPGNACLSSLMSGRMGTTTDPINDSKGCGGVMRIAPVGYFLPMDAVFDTACGVAAITHGHPTGYLAAGCLAHIIGELSCGADLPGAVRSAAGVLETRPRHEECLAALTAALAFGEKAMAPGADMDHDAVIESLGQGWIAEEALAVGVYCAMAARGDIDRGLRLAVNHSGDSDSTGSITGNILGALLGFSAIPEAYLTDLELLPVIQELARDLFERMPDGDRGGKL